MSGLENYKTGGAQDKKPTSKFIFIIAILGPVLTTDIVSLIFSI